MEQFKTDNLFLEIKEKAALEVYQLLKYVFKLNHDLFGAASLYKIQFSFANFSIEQLNLKVDRFVCSVWVAGQLQLQKDEILIGIVPHTLE
jgi:hypothetical protein